MTCNLDNHILFDIIIKMV